MKARIVQFVSDTPIVFIGAVLAIAITFRVGIGAIKTASAEPEPREPTAAAIHTPVAPSVAGGGATPTVTKAEPAPVLADPTLPKQDNRLSKPKKPRSHGKR